MEFAVIVHPYIGVETLLAVAALVDLQLHTAGFALGAGLRSLRCNARLGNRQHMCSHSSRHFADLADPHHGAFQLVLGRHCYRSFKRTVGSLGIEIEDGNLFAAHINATVTVANELLFLQESLLSFLQCLEAFVISLWFGMGDYRRLFERGRHFGVSKLCFVHVASERWIEQASDCPVAC